jgi:hypothetical protein
VRRPERWRVVIAATLVAGLPTAAYLAAPASAKPVPEAPAADLAGFNTSSTSAGVQFELLLPGIVPLGNPTLGNFLQASLPYSDSSTSTGPANGTVSAPVWPGDAVATAGNALQTFSPNIPQALVNLLNDPLVARSNFPGQVGAGTTGSFSPTGPAGIGSATTSSSEGGTTGTAAITDLTPLGVSKGVPLIDIASATSSTTGSVGAASVSNSAETRIGRITIAGVITIDGIDTTASASSDGRHGDPTATTDIGSVKVAGVSASIGPDGITLNGKGQGGTGAIVTTANKVLAALSKVGVSIRTLAPMRHVDGTEADATSGAVVIDFQDNNIPNLGSLIPQLPIPTPNSVGVELSLGLSQAEAAATLQPNIDVPPVTSTSPPSTSPGTGVTGGGVPPCLGCGLPTVGESTSPGGASAPVIAGQQPTAFGVPVRTAWVVISLLLAVLVAGPLLTYANWQLLRGRTP